MSNPPLQILQTAGRSATELAEAFAGALEGRHVLAPIPPDPIEAAAVRALLAPALADPDVLAEGTALVVSTSGSTGRPKGVMLSGSAIRAGAEATHARIGGPGEWTLALGAHYVAGAMVVCRAVLADEALHLTSPDLTHADGLATRPGARQYLSVVPTQLSRVMADPLVMEELARYDAILVGGAATDAHLLDRVREQGLRLVTTYGMSETSGGCLYDGVPLDGATVGCDPGTGRVSITGPMVFSGYLGRPDLTAEVLQGLPGDPVRTFRSDDRGHLDADGHLHLQGRMDEVVISGGLNVDLAIVQARARRALGTTELVALGVPDDDWGQRVVLVTTATTSLAEVRDLLGAHLPAHALPRGLSHVEVLPLTNSGKIDRRALARDWPAMEQKETV